MCVCLCARTQAQGSKVEKVYNETVPVNAASELRKRPPSLYASSRGNVMQKAKVWCPEQHHRLKHRLRHKCFSLTASLPLPGMGVQEGDLD